MRHLASHRRGKKSPPRPPEKEPEADQPAYFVADRKQLLASASYDDTIKLYAADPYDDEWQCIHTLTAHSGTVWSLSFSPCGRYLASAGDDLVIKLWERVSLLEEQKQQKDLGELGEAKRVEGGRMGPWSAGGVRIGIKEKWRWEERGEIRDAHERTIYAIDWKAGGAPSSEGGLGRIVSAGGDGRINVFQIVSAHAFALSANWGPFLRHIY